MNDPSEVTLTLRLKTPSGAPLGFLAIDRMVAGRCCGGVRMTATVGPPELGRLARIMTLKCGYLGLASGGAKAGIVLEPGSTPDERAARVRTFGLAIAPLVRSGFYSMGTDLGTTQADVDAIREAAGFSASADSGPSSGDFAGLTVALSALAALRARGIDPRGARVAIQGAGAVGQAAAAVLRREGVRIVAAATIDGTLAREGGLDADTLKRGESFRSGAGARPPEAVLEVPCDVFIPCAGSGTIDTAAAATLPASIVVCGANDAFAPGAEERLLARQVLVVPDFVANGGGVLGSTLVSAVGASTEEVDELMRRHFLPRVAATLEEARRLGEPVAEPARREALAFLAACDRAYGSTRPPSLLPEGMAPRASLRSRLLLALERRARGSRKLAPLGRRLRPLGLRRVGDVLNSVRRVAGDPAAAGPAPARLPRRFKRAVAGPLRSVARWIPPPVHLGRGFRRAWRELRKSERLDAEGLKAIADGKLRRLVAHAYEQVPYYRELFDRERIDPREIRGVADLPRIPILTKAILRERFEDLKARDFAAHHPGLHHSGGSTGEQTRFYLSQRAMDAELAAAWRHYHQAGYRFRDRVASLYLPLEGPAANLLCYESWKTPTLHLNTRLFTGERMRAMIDAVVAYRADVLWAYPSHLEMLCRYVEETGDDRFRPRVVVTNAEVLYDCQRTRARKLLGCDVFDWYGLAEHTAAAAECEQHGYHVPEEIVAVELLADDGEPAVGEPGDIIGTSLENYAQPLLRYRTGDYASWREGSCPCGRSHRMLSEIGGRTQDVITTPNGIRTFRHGALALEGIPGLEAVQIEQCEIRRFIVRAVAPRGLSDAAKQEVARSLLRAIGFEASVRVDLVDQMPRTKRGKHQLVISRVPFSFAGQPTK